MGESSNNAANLRRVLIASANPLFARALENMIHQHWKTRGVTVRMAESLEEALNTLDAWQPHLVIVDYDDVGRPGAISREAFLGYFISGRSAMQVMLVSLRESGEVVVYDRRTLTPAEAEDWLDLPWQPVPNQTTKIEQKPAQVQTGTAPISEPRVSAAEEMVYSLVQPTARSGGMKHYVIAGVLVAILTVLTYFVLQLVGLLPVAASAQAGPIDRMVQLQLWMISFLFSLIVVFIGYSVVVFRGRKGDRTEGAFFKGSTGLEIVWTLFPLATVIYLSFLGAQALGDVRKADPNAITINVTAFQWGWIYEYPEQGVQSNILYLPVDQQVLLRMTSRDVIHSFWVPEFRVKQDVLPGENLVKELRITPTRIGEYTVMCAELCGGAHAYMNTPVRVVSRADYDAWLASEAEAADAPPAERGQRVANGSGCLACHSIDGSQLAGPTWQGLAGSEVQLTDGSTVVADDAYLLESIVEPNAKIHQGFPPIMPATYDETLDEQAINDIVEYIKSLE